jgi:uncharacterized protein
MFMASSYKVDIGGLLAGGRQHLLVDQQVEVEPFEGMSFPQGAHLRVELHATGSMLEIAGSLDAEARGECDRCLGEVARSMHIDVDERFDAGPDAASDPFADNNVVTGDRLDVKDLASQLLYSAVPIGTLCSKECKGLCSTCGENKNTGACTCESDSGEK